MKQRTVGRIGGGPKESDFTLTDANTGASPPLGALQLGVDSCCLECAFKRASTASIRASREFAYVVLRTRRQFRGVSVSANLDLLQPFAAKKRGRGMTGGVRMSRFDIDATRREGKI